LQLPLIVEAYRILKRFVLRKLKRDSGKEKIRGILHLIWWNLTEFHVPWGKKKHILSAIEWKYREL